MIESHLPSPTRNDRPRSNNRMILNGIIYVLIIGWSEMPEKYRDDLTANLKSKLNVNAIKKESQ